LQPANHKADQPGRTGIGAKFGHFIFATGDRAFLKPMT
jgi:hypothetical protein